MLFSLLDSSLRLRIDVPGATGCIERSRTRKLPLNLLRSNPRVVRMIFIEALLPIADRGAVAGVGEHHGAWNAFGRLDEKYRHVRVRDTRRVGPEIIAPVFLAHAPVHAERSLPSPE
jgi:hypothetical protein